MLHLFYARTEFNYLLDFGIGRPSIQKAPTIIFVQEYE